MAASTGATSLSQLSSGHSLLYESYWRQADVSGCGKLSASEAAAYLKKSNLSDVVLHEIWKLVNPLGKPHLDKQEFYLSLRLISNAQNGKEVSLRDMNSPGPAPKLGDLPISPVVPPPPNDGSAWLIQGPDKLKYDGVFESLIPVNGLLSGDKVKPVLLNSKLHVDVLGRVWDLSDVDKDGMLDKDEFAVAMYLVYKALDGEQVPNVLPKRLIPPSKRSLVRGSANVSPGVSPTPTMVSTAVAPTTGDVPWVVTTVEKSKYDVMFKTADKDNDNLVTGDEVKNIFMASGLPQASLAHIWGLCDMNDTGRLNGEQFGLAMHLIHKKVKGIEPPQTLPPEMIPPSLRVAGKTLLVPATSPLHDVKKETKSSSMAGELDQITKEIGELGKNKTTLQKDIEETEDLVRHRHIEVQDLENELEKAKDEMKDLEKRKNETKGQLDNLDKEKAKYEDLLKEVQKKCQEETQKINSLKSQIAEHDSSIQSQEDKLSVARSELNKLRQQETELENEVQHEKDKLESIQKQVNSVQTEIAQVETKLNTVKDSNASLNGEIHTYNGLLQTGTSTNNQSNASLGMSDLITSDGFSDLMTTPSEMDTMSMRATAGSSPVSSISGFSVGSGRVDEAVDDFKDKDGGEDDKEVDPFKSKEDAETSDPFTSDDPFKSDPFAQFKSVSFADPFSSDPFEEKDPFGHSDTKSSESPFKSDPFTNPVTTKTTQAASTSDPFSSSDPFHVTYPDDKSSSEDFFSGDPFKSTSNDTSPSKTNSPSKDPFQNTDFFRSNDLFDGSRTTNDSTDGNKPVTESDDFANAETDPFKSTSANSNDDPFTATFASFPEPSKQRQSKGTKSSERDMIEWAKRQSKRDEKDRQKKFKSLQDEEEKQLAHALQKSLDESNA